MQTKIPPVFRYPGSKWRLAEWIISNMPPHECYCEPFFGSGAVYFNKAPSRIEFINDVDGNVVNFFTVCREMPEELGRALYLTPYARQEFERARATPSQETDRLERARRFAIRCSMSMCGNYAGGTWSLSTGKEGNGGSNKPRLWSRLPEAVYQIADRLKSTHIENSPAIDLIKRLNGSQVLLYADPPYLKSTRTAHREQYSYEMSDSDHEELLASLLEHKGMVLLSGYESDMYNKMLAGWKVERVKVRAERSSTRVECLWINPAAERLLNRQLKLG